MSGPLTGYKVIEIAGIGPGPFCAMLLADMGADVLRVDRAQAVKGPAPSTPAKDISLRGRRSVAIDLKHPEGVATLLDLVAEADALIEGFRPGVMERLGIGPDACLGRNPRLVFGRMTGWGQEGPYAQAAGHDINYISLAGALAHIGRAGEAPVPPLNLIGDFGGGGMFLAFGVVCAILEAQRSGAGQVVDAAMVDGSATLMTMFWSMWQSGGFDQEHRGTNLLDTGAHFYDIVPLPRRRVCLRRIDRAAVLRPAAAEDRARRRRRVPGPARPRQLAGAQGPPRRRVRDEDPRRVVRADGALRCLLRAGADDGRGCRAPAQRGPLDHHRA